RARRPLLQRALAEHRPRGRRERPGVAHHARAGPRARLPPRDPGPWVRLGPRRPRALPGLPALALDADGGGRGAWRVDGRRPARRRSRPLRPDAALVRALPDSPLRHRTSVRGSEGPPGPAMTGQEG